MQQQQSPTNTLQLPLPHAPAPVVISVQSAANFAITFPDFSSEGPGSGAATPKSRTSKKRLLLVLALLAVAALSGALAYCLNPASDPNNTTPVDTIDGSASPFNASHFSNKNASSFAPLTHAVSAREASDPMLGCIYVQYGTRVARGRDWEWGNQDGGAGSIGTVIQDLSDWDSDGWVIVRWASTSVTDWYRITGGYCDLRLLDSRNNFVTVGSWIYSTVTDVPADSSSISAHRYYLPIPSGWQIAPDNSESRSAIMQFRWSTHIAVMASGVGIRTRNYPPAGREFGDQQSKYVVNSVGWVNCPWTAYQIIIRKSAAGSPPAVDICPSKKSCSECTSESSCGWCPLQSACKTGSSSSSADAQCVKAQATWYWCVQLCFALRHSQ
jgi:hypothetical protein